MPAISSVHSTDDNQSYHRKLKRNIWISLFTWKKIQEKNFYFYWYKFHFSLQTRQSKTRMIKKNCDHHNEMKEEAKNEEKKKFEWQ